MLFNKDERKKIKKLRNSLKDSKVKDVKINLYNYNPNNDINAIKKFVSGFRSKIAAINKTMKTDPKSALKLNDDLWDEFRLADEANQNMGAELTKLLLDMEDVIYESKHEIEDLMYLRSTKGV